MEKSARLNKIKEIISSKSIASQEELQSELSKFGFLVTQATLSRDLKHLRVVKVSDSSGAFSYSVQESGAGELMEGMPDHLESVLSIEFSGQLGVMKTIPGFANAVAYFIDRLKLPQIMGTIAGDDTILIIPREGVSHNTLAGIFSKYFTGLQHKIQ